MATDSRASGLIESRRLSSIVEMRYLLFAA